MPAKTPGLLRHGPALRLIEHPTLRHLLPRAPRPGLATRAVRSAPIARQVRPREAAGSVKPRPLARAGQIRPAPLVGARTNLGPGRQIDSQDSPNGRRGPGLNVRRLGELVDLIFGIGLGAAEHLEQDILDATAASRAHPMSKAQERGGRVPGFSTGVQKDILVCMHPFRVFRRRGGTAARRPDRSGRPRTRTGPRIRSKDLAAARRTACRPPIGPRRRLTAGRARTPGCCAEGRP